MLDELAPLVRGRALYLPGVLVTAWALSGVLWRGWSSGEAVFWVWVELVFASISLTLLLFAWNREARAGDPSRAWRELRATLAASALVVGLATMFTVLALVPEIGGRGALGTFLHERRSPIVALGLFFASVHVLVRRSPELRGSPRRAVERPWAVRAFSFLGVYLAAIFHHHLLDGDGRALGTMEYGRLIAGWLLGARLLIELWSAWKAPLSRE